MGQIITGKCDIVTFQCDRGHEFTYRTGINALWEDHTRAPCSVCHYAEPETRHEQAHVLHILRDVVVTLDEDESYVDPHPPSL